MAKLSEGDHGKLLVKSPNVMSWGVLLSYLDDPERTKSVFDEEGFYRTGDLVHLSAQGEYIYEKRINKPPKNPVLFMENILYTLPYLHNTLVAQLPFDHAYGSSMLGLVVSSMTEYMADCMYRLRAALSLTFLQLDTMVPLAVCVLGPGKEMKWEKGDLRDVFPYHVDPGFRTDFEIGMHRA
ncbi:putative NRPS-like protein biosynthetic cluster [Aspergillus melleus]|uniref:NRPS-like protein biosynthetic cluster n=1 Tax=Aspergillus melleus TaxID=138277 RepID=A0ACC3B481_9EURO|nr:putative NRPS-like protein biosynthetic cluster [Aspergillus melleus]